MKTEEIVKRIINLLAGLSHTEATELLAQVREKINEQKIVKV